jgi:hypothetical protein
MSEGLTVGEFSQRELKAAQRLLDSMEASGFGDSDGHSCERAIPEQIEDVRALIARVTDELAKTVHRP